MARAYVDEDTPGWFEGVTLSDPDAGETPGAVLEVRFLFFRNSMVGIKNTVK